MTSEKSKKKTNKVSKDVSPLFGKRLTSEDWTDGEGRGFRVQALRHKEVAYIRAMARDNEFLDIYWTFRLGVKSFINVLDKDDKPIDLVTHDDPLHGGVSYMDEDQFEQIPMEVVAEVAMIITSLSRLSSSRDSDGNLKLRFTSDSKTAKA